MWRDPPVGFLLLSPPPEASPWRTEGSQGQSRAGMQPGRRGEAAGLVGHTRLHVPKRSLVTGSRPVCLGRILTKPFWPRIMDSSPDRLGNERVGSDVQSVSSEGPGWPCSGPLEGRALGGSLVFPHGGCALTPHHAPCSQRAHWPCPWGYVSDFPHLLPNYGAGPWRTEGKDVHKWAENGHNVESKSSVSSRGLLKQIRGDPVETVSNTKHRAFTNVARPRARAWHRPLTCNLNVRLGHFLGYWHSQRKKRSGARHIFQTAD